MASPPPLQTNAASPSLPSDSVEWDYVALGESITGGMTACYAEILAQDLGVTIIPHAWQVPDRVSSTLVEELQTNGQLRQDLREAEVITFHIPLGVLASATRKYAYGEPGDCGGADNLDCIRVAFSIDKSDAEAIISEIASLRSLSEALIRGIDNWQIKASETKERGSFEMYNAYWRVANAWMREVASRYDIPVARVLMLSWVRAAKEIQEIWDLYYPTVYIQLRKAQP